MTYFRISWMHVPHYTELKYKYFIVIYIDGMVVYPQPPRT